MTTGERGIVRTRLYFDFRFLRCRRHIKFSTALRWFSRHDQKVGHFLLKGKKALQKGFKRPFRRLLFFFFILLLSFILEAKINVKLILYRVLIITSSFEREQLVALLKLVCFELTYYLPFPQYLVVVF